MAPRPRGCAHRRVAPRRCFPRTYPLTPTPSLRSPGTARCAPSRPARRLNRTYRPPIFALGTLFGLASAWGHSLAYLASRGFTGGSPERPARGSAFDLLVLAHALLGVGAAALLAATWDAAAVAGALGPLGVSFVCFLVAQASLFAALQRVEASTVAPLLSAKIVALAGLSWALEGRPVTPLAALAIALAMGGAAVVGGAGKRPDARSLAVLLAAVCGYAGCDMGIVRAIDAMTPPGPSGAQSLGAALRCVGVLYSALGLLAAALLPWVLGRGGHPGVSPGARWAGAASYAACWALAMATLFSAFSLLPVVLVAILQSTRSLWSVLLGGLLGRLGFGHLETRHGAGVLGLRVAGAAALVAAVGLYAWASVPPG